MDDEQLPPEEQQPRPNSFRDAVNEIHSPTPKAVAPVQGSQGGAPSYARSDWPGAPGNTTQPQDDGYNDLSPLEKYNEGRQGKSKGLNQSDFSTDLAGKGFTNKATALGKAAAGVPKKSAQATTDNVKRVGKFAKNKKWFAVGGGVMAILIPILLFFFWLMLFKNVHIKNLYVTYRWAQFNRGLNKAAKEQLEAQKTDPAEKPSGSSESTVSPDETPEELSKKTNADEFERVKNDPQKLADELTDLEKSSEGGAEKALKDVSVERTVKPAEGDTPEEQAKSAKANVEEELSKGKGLEGDVPESIKDGVDEASKQQEAGKTAAQAAEEGATKIVEGSGWKGAIQKTSGAFVVATFYCIFHDIYVSAKEQINKIALAGAMGAAQELNKTADCQKLGKCTAAQVGAVAEKMDDATSSFTQSCGYTRATQSSSPNCKEIDPQYIVDGLAKQVRKVAGPAGTAVTTTDFFLDPPKFPGLNTDQVCSAVMNPYVQASAAVINLGLIAGSGGGWAAVSQSVAGGAVAFAATAGGKALIATAILKHTGGLYEKLTPVDVGNLIDFGNTATASAACSAIGCPQISDTQANQLDTDYRAERIEKNSKRSIAEKFFDVDSPDSVTSRVVLNTPTTPTAVIGRIKTVFASLTNPIKLNLTLGNNALSFTSNNSALADASGSPFGLNGKVAVPPNLLPGAPSRDDALTWAKSADLSSYKEKFDSCKEASYTASVSSNDDSCSWDSFTEEMKYFYTYKFYQRVGYDAARLGNKQSDASGGGGGTGSSATVSTSALVGKNTKGQPCPAGTTFSKDAKTFKGVDISLCTVYGIEVNVSIAANVKNMIDKAKGDSVTLTGSSFRSYEEQVALRIKHKCPDPSTPSSGCTIPTAPPGKSRHEEGLAIDFAQYSFNWLKDNAATYGLYNLPSESWHWSVDGN